MTERAPLLVVEELAFARGGCDVLLQISWQVQDGDFAFIVGENGAGKTTLLKCLCRILKPRTGRITLADRSLNAYAPRELARQVSYLPQADERVVPYRVDNFVAMGRYPHLNPWAGLARSDRDAIAEAMARVGVEHLATRLMTTLSGGERRKVAIAAALAQGARLLLLDEPATFLDPRHQIEVRQILRQLNADGITVIAVSHDLNQLAALATNVLALRRGQSVFAGPATDFLQPEPLHDTFGIDFHVDTDANQRPRVYPLDPI